MLSICPKRGFAKFRDALRAQCGEEVFENFFSGLALIDAVDGCVRVGVDSRATADLVCLQIEHQKVHLFTECFGADVGVEFVVVSDSTRPDQIGGQERFERIPAASSASPVNLRAAPSPRQVDVVQPVYGEQMGPGQKRINPKHTLDRFVVNETNRVAAFAVERFVSGAAPGVTYLYGSMGWGKTHLLDGAALAWGQLRPDDKIFYVAYEHLIGDVSDAILSNRLKEIRSHFDQTDVLIFDDLHMLRGRMRTQEELTCFIDRLAGAGKSILIAGGQSPHQLGETGISKRLTQRLTDRATVSIKAPDESLKRAFVERCAGEFTDRTGIEIPERHLALIARRFAGTIRELHMLMNVLELNIESGADPYRPLSDEDLQGFLAHDDLFQRREATADSLLTFVAEVFGVSELDLRGKSRRQPIVRARHAFCLAARKLTSEPLVSIGAVVKRDHTTVMHSIRQAENIAQRDSAFGAKITKIMDEFA